MNYLPAFVSLWASQNTYFIWPHIKNLYHFCGKFQVVVRETNGGAASAPLTLAVKLLDENDNSPVIPKTQPIIVPASLEPTIVHKVFF